MPPKSTAKNGELIELLNEALRLEYTLIVHYPRLAAGIPDEETRKLVQQLGTASVHHADVVSEAVTQLGGKPDWTFAPFPQIEDPRQIFEIQLRKEQQALELHRKAAGLVPPGPMAAAIESLAQEEQVHISMVEKIIARLKE
jgi:rubrerythrin